ncbi:MAG: YkgJ family cysteine cluster protein [Spirochaetaceae bacterium]|jgi:Fe-S-cluster containining protein|nr:YkgJ family cysteine cluster protein [Spirochaetaceae bacterium]
MKPFYEDGLRWSCKRCSNCCRYESGYVFLSRNDLSNLSRALKMPPDEFIQVYCRWISPDGKIEYLVVKELSNRDCFFWKDGCSIYDIRPVQCRIFPFWQGCMADEEVWRSSMSSCPGLGEGKLYSKEEIESCFEIERVEHPIGRPARCSGPVL